MPEHQNPNPQEGSMADISSKINDLLAAISTVKGDVHIQIYRSARSADISIDLDRPFAGVIAGHPILVFKSEYQVFPPLKTEAG